MASALASRPASLEQGITILDGTDHLQRWRLRGVRPSTAPTGTWGLLDEKFFFLHDRVRPVVGRKKNSCRPKTGQRSRVIRLTIPTNAIRVPFGECLADVGTLQPSPKRRSPNFNEKPTWAVSAQCRGGKPGRRGYFYKNGRATQGAQNTKKKRPWVAGIGPKPNVIPSNKQAGHQGGAFIETKSTAATAAPKRKLAEAQSVPVFCLVATQAPNQKNRLQAQRRQTRSRASVREIRFTVVGCFCFEGYLSQEGGGIGRWQRGGPSDLARILARGISVRQG